MLTANKMKSIYRATDILAMIRLFLFPNLSTTLTRGICNKNFDKV